MNGNTILAISHPGELTSTELERFAYIQGNKLMASYAAQADELEEQVDGFDDLVDNAKSDAFEEGKQAGMGQDTAHAIADLESDLMAIKASHQRCRDNLQAVHDWLRSDDCKTVKGRLAFQKRLLSALHVTPRY
jgi:hypothetical protein